MKTPMNLEIEIEYRKKQVLFVLLIRLGNEAIKEPINTFEISALSDAIKALLP